MSKVTTIGEKRDPNARAEDPRTCTADAPERRAERVDVDRAERDDVNYTECRVPRAEQSSRSLESVRAEAAYRDPNALPPSARPLAVARTDLARAFDAVMHEHWLRGDAALSNVVVARACGVDEKQIRQWREGEKPLPAAALTLFPGRLYDEILETIERMRGRARKRSVFLLREALDGLGAELAAEDPRDAQRVVNDAQRTLLEIAAGLTR